MHKMEELRDMLCEELERIAASGELTAGSLETIDKLTHSIKSIDTIMAMDGASWDDGSYNRDRGYSRAQRRDSRGRYSRNYRYGRMNRYSYDKESMMEQLEDMLDEAQDQKTREAIHKAIKHLEG